MCGIAALIEPGRRFEASLLEAMGEDLRHRGPDSGGIISEPGVGLVFRRLAILDPSARADQPMTDSSGKITLIFNGEIYNFRELRQRLEAEGIKFHTTGDAEVILQGYLAWGEAILDRLEGMYAFVLVDRRSGIVVAARDPFGIKPLYLLQHGRLVGLASEMRPFARVAVPEPDPAALAELLTFGWAAGSMSNLKGIERIPGGTVLIISLSDGNIKRCRFCDPLDTLGKRESINRKEALERAHEALRSSVSAHLISDVGYSVQLSGGVDSSLVTGMAATITGERLDTFGVALPDTQFDEGAWRRQVIQRYDVDHHEAPFSGRDFADALPRAVRHMEGPSPHLGCVFLMMLCDRIRKKSKVVLTGEGADEFFGGYSHYKDWRRLRAREKAARILPTSLLPDMAPFKGVKRFASHDMAAYASVRFDPHSIHSLFPALVPGPGAREQASARFQDFRDRLFAVDQVGYLESLLVRQDKMAMAASVEARVPFVHLPLARLINSMPRNLIAPGGITKPLLKAVSQSYLPHDLIHRRKIGLLLPVGDWLEDEKGLGRYLDDIVDPASQLAAYTDRRCLAATVDDFRKGDHGAMRTLVRMINIETWLRSLKSIEPVNQSRLAASLKQDGG